MAYEGSVRFACGMAHLDQSRAMPVESPGNVIAEARFDEAHTVARHEVPVEPSRKGKLVLVTGASRQAVGSVATEARAIKEATAKYSSPERDRPLAPKFRFHLRRPAARLW
jgi:hypothetical protein